MVEMVNDDEVKKIVEDTLKEYRKTRNYQWTREHPGIVENLAVIFGAGLLLAILACGGVWSIAHDNLQGYEKFQNAIIKNTSCSELKNILHNLNSNDDNYGIDVSIVKDELTARC